MIVLRFLLPLSLVLILSALLMLPWTDKLFMRWYEADLQTRSRLVFSSIETSLPEILAGNKTGQLARRFTQLVRDQRLVGLGYCDGSGVAPKFKSENFPVEVGCPFDIDTGRPAFITKLIKGGKAMIGTYPLHEYDRYDLPPEAATVVGRPGMLIIIHDMAYIEKRSQSTQYYVLAFVIGISLLSALITIVIAKLTLSRWIVNLRNYVRTGRHVQGLPREALSLTREIQQRLRSIEREQQRPVFGGVKWSPETLYEFVSKHMPSEQLISVSFRQPYAHKKTDNGIEWSVPASGLVTAIEPIMKACRGTWIAVSSGDADRETVDANDSLMVPPDAPAYRLKRLWLTPEEEQGFYAGYANEGIWPLCNMAYVKPRFRSADWAMYKIANQKFADAVAAEAKSSSPIIFIQDYHFGLLPKLIREKLPKALIIVFWHVPWPNSEVLSILPQRDEFLQGLLAADIVGFHTQFHCNNFLDCVDTHIEALVDREHDTVRIGGNLCMVRPYPISIAWPDFAALDVPSVALCRERLFKQLGISKEVKLILGVERLDYIKGIPERLRAFDLFLDKHREMHGKVCFVQVASPSRTIIAAYSDILREVEDVAREINAKYGSTDREPVKILRQYYNPSEVYKFYRGADVCVVSSLHDGMNLVAKEFIAARDDEHGVLVLSQFAGSSRELIDALIVNPYDDEGLAQSLSAALLMGDDEQSARMKSMREHVRAKNVFAWAAEILSDVSVLHRRRELNDLLTKMNDSNA